MTPDAMDEFRATRRQPFPPVTFGDTLRQAAAVPWLHLRCLGALFSQAAVIFGSRLGTVARPMRRIKLVPRYLRGAHLGWLLARYLLSDEAHLPSRRYPWYGDFFGTWGVAIIATDYVLDSQPAAAEAAHAFLADFLGILGSQEFTGKQALPAPAGERSVPSRRLTPSPGAAFLALGLGRLVKTKADKLRRAWPDGPRWRAAWEQGEQEWLSRTRDLLAGQLKSLGQFHCTEAHNWKWYYQEILNQKTLNFFLAPIALYCLTPTSLRKFEILKEFFLLLNSLFFHWQLMDDIADLVSDTTAGMVTAPGYIIMSQGQLAAHLWNHTDLFDNNTDINNDELHDIVGQEIIRPALESGLLSEEFCSPSFWCEITAYRDGKTRNDGSAGLVALARRCARRALANLPGEDRWSLPELCAQRVAQKEQYRQALANGDIGLAVALVLESGAAQRLLRVAQDAERGARLSAGLRQLDDPALLAVLRTLQGMMARACRRAIQVVERFHPEKA